MTGLGLRAVASAVTCALVAAVLTGCADGAKVRELQQSPLPLSGTWRPGLFIEGYGPQGLGPAATATPTASPTADETLSEPDQVLLAPLGLVASDVTNGYRVELVEKGTSLMEPTLGFCGKDYPSEDAREARRRLVLVGPAGEQPGILSEAVLYTTPKAAAQALDELRTATATCDASVPLTGTDGTSSLTVAQTSTGDLDLSGFVAPSERVVVAATLTNNGTGAMARLLTAYQVRGRVLVALYFQNAAGEEFDAEQRKAFALLGKKLAARLGALDAAVADGS